MLTYPFVLNNVTYNESDFVNLGYVTKLGAAFWDLVNQILLGFGSTSTTSLVITALATPTNMTIGAGLAWQVGDTILCLDTANPTTNGFAGIVTAYNFGTGAIAITPMYFNGAGTIASWAVMPGGMPSAAAHTALPNFIAIEQGGTGFSGADALVGAAQPWGAQGATLLGIDAPRSSMEEIFVDFTTEGQVALSGGFATGNAAPFSLSPTQSIVTTSDALGLAACDDNLFFGGVYITPGLVYANVLPNVSCVLSYNNSGFFHVGRGRVVYETVIVNLYNSNYYRARFGLAAQNSTNPNIFSFGGIGFECFNVLAIKGSQYSSGYIVCCAGANGTLQRVITNVTPVAGSMRFRIEVDHPGQNATFYINDTLVATITGNLPMYDYKNLLLPAWECEPDPLAYAASAYSYMLLDTLYLSKSLLR